MKATLEPKGKFLVDAGEKRIAVMLDLATSSTELAANLFRAT
ncbi:MAG: hypothetical protein ACR2H1_05790 [Limisphaerales bacterium]